MVRPVCKKKDKLAQRNAHNDVRTRTYHRVSFGDFGAFLT